MLRILLGIASGGQPTRPFLESLGRLQLPPGAAPLERSVAFGNFIPGQRELIMRDAIEGGFDYLLFVDDDIVLPEHALVSMVALAEADPRTAVVGGLYYTRDSSRPVIVDDWSSDDTSSAHIPAFTTTSQDPVDGVGFGCALLRVAVARDLAPPYFPVHVYVERRSRRVRQCDEDYRYCERVRQAGFRVRLDGRVRCEHYDRGSDSTAPVAWESDEVTAAPRMIVAVDGRTELVPLDESVPRITEEHARADVVYITVDS